MERLVQNFSMGWKWWEMIYDLESKSLTILQTRSKSKKYVMKNLVVILTL